jgi:hypothetical protein
VAQRVPGRLRPPDFRDVRHYKGGRSSSLRTGRLYPNINPWYSFSEAESTPGHMVPSGTTEKIPSDTTGNRSRDLPTSSVVPPGPLYNSTTAKFYVESVNVSVYSASNWSNCIALNYKVIN